MSFWTTSAGQVATGEVAGGDFEDHLPKGKYKCIIEEAKTREFEGVRSIQLSARVIDGEKKNRLSFLKINAWADDDKKRDRAINILVRLAGIVGVPLPDGEPDDMWLSKLTDKPLIIDIGVFEIPSGEAKGKKVNFIQTVESCGKTIKPAAKPVARKPAPAPVVEDAEQEEYAPDLEDSDIPF